MMKIGSCAPSFQGATTTKVQAVIVLSPATAENDYQFPFGCNKLRIGASVLLETFSGFAVKTLNKLILVGEFC